MRRAALLGLAMICVAAWRPAPSSAYERARYTGGEEDVMAWTHARMEEDIAAVRRFRPGFTFWQYVFTTPDGTVLYASAEDGRVIARFPENGDWMRGARFEEGALSSLLTGQSLARRLTDRRDQVAALLEDQVGPVVHNPTRGDFLLPNVRRYGAFLAEWTTIYERFGVPGEIGLAQAIVESGLAGGIKSEARAIGFCQWLPSNWNRLKRLSPNPIEPENQTTQAPYCAAYLSVLATKYGSFIPALSEHHAGGTNVGRTVINGFRLGGQDIREQYFLGSSFALDLRAIAPRTFRTVLGSYGPRSFRYAEMVFGNTFTVKNLRETIPQRQIYAFRANRNIPIAQIAERAAMTTDEVKRFNPALVRQVPKGANLYLPVSAEQFGPDVSFWHRPAPDDYVAVLNDFVRLQATPEEWENPAFDAVLRSFRHRFEQTKSEEGTIMATVLGYVLQEMPTSRRILAEYRTSPSVRSLFERGVERRRQALAAGDI
jgi:hypothetical protein